MARIFSSKRTKIGECGLENVGHSFDLITMGLILFINLIYNGPYHGLIIERSSRISFAYLKISDLISITQLIMYHENEALAEFEYE